MKSLLVTLSLFLSNTIFGFEIIDVDPTTVKEQVESSMAIVVDVREQNEIEQGMLSIASWLPMTSVYAEDQSFQDWISMVKEGEFETVYAYCRSGNRVSKFKKILEAYDIEIINIGGFSKLSAQGFEVK